MLPDHYNQLFYAELDYPLCGVASAIFFNSDHHNLHRSPKNHELVRMEAKPDNYVEYTYNYVDRYQAKGKEVDAVIVTRVALQQNSEAGTISARVDGDVLVNDTSLRKIRGFSNYETYQYNWPGLDTDEMVGSILEFTDHIVCQAMAEAGIG